MSPAHTSLNMMSISGYQITALEQGVGSQGRESAPEEGRGNVFSTSFHCEVEECT